MTCEHRDEDHGPRCGAAAVGTYQWGDEDVAVCREHAAELPVDVEVSDECTADLGHPCDGGGGEGCSKCRAEAAYWAAEYARTPASMRRLDSLAGIEEIRRECEEAGRHV